MEADSGEGNGKIWHSQGATAFMTLALMWHSFQQVWLARNGLAEIHKASILMHECSEAQYINVAHRYKTGTKEAAYMP